MGNLDELRNQILGLSRDGQLEILDTLLASFSPHQREVIDKAWLAEALDRIAAYDRGEMEAFTVEDVQKSIGL